MGHFATEVEVVYETVQCCNCGLWFALESAFMRGRKRDQRSFFCPNGHSQFFTGKTPEQEKRELQAQLDAARKTQERLRADVEHEAARARGYKGALTKAKKRIGKGVCPACNRHFENVERHMHTQHPDLVDDDGEPTWGGA